MTGSKTPQLNAVLRVITGWVRGRPDVLALALIGSYARNEARPDSDIDLLLLTDVPEAFRASDSWLNEIDWPTHGAAIQSWSDAQYGVIWSRHVTLSNGTMIEFSFGLPSWASHPVDAGTRDVVSGGLRVLFDPRRLLTPLGGSWAPTGSCPVQYP